MIATLGLSLLCLGGFDLQPDHVDVKQWVTYLRTDRRYHVQQSLQRAERHIPVIRDAFLARKVPRALIWLPLIESGFETDARSPAGAVGMFQFRPETARQFGLRVDDSVDERTDARRSAQACASYLSYLHDAYQCWDLALAAYVSGEGTINRARAQTRLGSWEQVEKVVAGEVRDYVYKIKAAALVGRAWSKLRQDRHRSDQIMHRVVRGQNLMAIAHQYSVSVEMIQAANQLPTTLIREGQELVIPRSETEYR